MPMYKITMTMQATFMATTEGTTEMLAALRAYEKLTRLRKNIESENTIEAWFELGAVASLEITEVKEEVENPMISEAQRRIKAISKKALFRDNSP